MENSRLIVRNKGPEFFKYCMKNQLHLCIVSAGLSGDFILIYSYPHEDIIATVLNQIIPIADYENL